MSLLQAHTVTLDFGGQLSRRKGEVQQFCYRLPACWHYGSSPFYLTLPTDHCSDIESDFSPALLKGQQDIPTSTTPFPCWHQLSGPTSFPPAPGFSLKLLHSPLNNSQKDVTNTGGWDWTADHTLFLCIHPSHVHNVYSEAILCVHTQITEVQFKFTRNQTTRRPHL